MDICNGYTLKHGDGIFKSTIFFALIVLKEKHLFSVFFSLKNYLKWKCVKFEKVCSSVSTS